MSDFQRDNIWQRRLRDEILVPGFYGEYATEGRYVLLDKGRLTSHFQRRLAVDTIVQGKNGAAVCIEEKIVRWPEKRGKAYTAFCLETESCTNPGHESDGWMVYGQADYLLYCFANARETVLYCHFIDFIILKKWFWENVDNFRPFQMTKYNRSRGRVVPIAAIEAAGIEVWSSFIEKPRLAA